MSNSMTSVLAAAALIASASLAFADSQTQAQPVSTHPAQRVVCHHDGEVVQGPNGLLVCHMRPVDGVQFKSPDWYRAISARAAGSNQ
jgi:hypothetical protein